MKLCLRLDRPCIVFKWVEWRFLDSLCTHSFRVMIVSTENYLVSGCTLVSESG